MPCSVIRVHGDILSLQPIQLSVLQHDRIKIFINGVRITDFSEDSLSSNAQNSDIQINVNQEHRIQSYNGTPDLYAGLYLAEIHFVDGQALSPTSFGEYNDDNVWQPIEFLEPMVQTVIFKLSDNATNTTTIGTDSSGNSNDLIRANNFGLTNAAQIVELANIFSFQLPMRQQ